MALVSISIDEGEDDAEEGAEEAEELDDEAESESGSILGEVPACLRLRLRLRCNLVLDSAAGVNDMDALSAFASLTALSAALSVGKLRRLHASAPRCLRAAISKARAASSFRSKVPRLW